MANETLDVQDLAEGAEVQRRYFNCITPPGVDLFQTMFPPVAPFVSTNFADAFLDGLLGEDKNSVAIYPLSLVLDPKTRETLVYNAEGELVATIPADGKSRTWPMDADPARVILRLDLLPSEDVEPYLYTEDRVALADSPTATRSAKVGRIGRRGMMVGNTNFGISGFQLLTNGTMRLTVTNGADVAEVFSYTIAYTSSVTTNELVTPEGVTNIYTNTVWTPLAPPFNGLESDWQCQETNLVLTNGVGIWEDSNISSNDRVRYYGLAIRADFDGDGLTDGAEKFVYHTNPSTNDTDGDDLSDGEEVNEYHTDPLVTDTDGDGLDDGAEVNEGTDPHIADTDHDGWRDGLDPDPKSRAWVDWGNPDLWINGAITMTNRYWPAWCKQAGFSTNGYNDFVASSYNVISNLPVFYGFTWIAVDTNLVRGTNMALWTRVSTNHVGWLYFQLRDMAWNNLVNNFLEAQYNPQYPEFINTASLAPSNGEILLKVPMSNAPSAANIIQERLTNAIAIYDSMIYLDANGDFLDDTQVAAITANPTNDYDEDGLADFWEYTHDFDFTRSDQDGNSVRDDLDDFDDDGLSNTQEMGLHTDPHNSDTDKDGLNDGEEVNDYGTDPLVADTDGDRLTDGEEVNGIGTDPNSLDTDEDGLLDGYDIVVGVGDERYMTWAAASIVHFDDNGLRTFKGELDVETDPLNPDTDGDGMPDGWEVANSLNPLVDDATGDEDGDGLTNLQEYQYGTDPIHADTDGDGMNDNNEILQGFDPTVANGPAMVWINSPESGRSLP